MVCSRSFLQAANLILAHQRHRAAALIPQVAQRLQAIGRAQAAAEVLEAIDDLKGGSLVPVGIPADGQHLLLWLIWILVLPSSVWRISMSKLTCPN